MILKKLSIAVLAATSIIASPAFAAASSSASLSDFSVTLISTDNGPTSISFANSFANYIALTAYNNNYTSYNNNNFSGTGDNSLTAHTANAQAAGSVTGTNGGTTLPASLSTSASANGNNGMLNYASSTVNGPYSGSFTLSANTIAIFRATGSANAATTVGYNPTTGASEYANSAASFSVSGSNGYQGYQYATDTISTSANYTQTFNYSTFTWQYGPQTSQNSGAMSAVFSNATGGTLNGNLTASASAYSLSNVSAVPEPTESALMLSGIALLGFIAARRKKTA